MECPEIAIRDIRRYGEDLTVPEAITRLCGGGPITVTDRAPPGGDPRGNPRQRLRHHRQARPRRPAGSCRR